MASVLADLTEVSAVGSAVIATLVQKEAQMKATLLPTVLNASAFDVPGAKSVSLGKANSLTAERKTENTAVEHQALTFGGDVLTFGQPLYVSSLVSAVSVSQTPIALKNEYINRFSTAMARKMDALIAAALVKSANDAQFTGTSNLLITKKDIAKASAALDKAGVELADRFLAIPPDQKAEIYTLLDTNFGKQELISNGIIGTVYGFNVVVSNAFNSGTEAVAYSRDHVGYIARPQEFKEVWDHDHLSYAWQVFGEFACGQLSGGAFGYYMDETAVE